MEGMLQHVVVVADELVESVCPELEDLEREIAELSFALLSR